MRRARETGGKGGRATKPKREASGELAPVVRKPVAVGGGGKRGVCRRIHGVP